MKRVPCRGGMKGVAMKGGAMKEPPWSTSLQYASYGNAFLLCIGFSNVIPIRYSTHMSDHPWSPMMSMYVMYRV